MKKFISIIFILAISVVAASCGYATKTVENQEITISLKDYGDGSVIEHTRTGLYTGTLINGIPEGEGYFEARNDAGDAWYYKGEFKNGTFNGQGEFRYINLEGWENYSETGTYTDGLFTPTKAELFDTISTEVPVKYYLSETSKQFISEHESFFPCKEENWYEVLEPYIDVTISYNQMQKNVKPYLENLVCLYGFEVKQAKEWSVFGHTVTVLNVKDDYTGDHYVIYYDGALPYCADDFVDEIVALPVDESSFDNASGGITNVIAAIGCVAVGY